MLFYLYIVVEGKKAGDRVGSGWQALRKKKKVRKVLQPANGKKKNRSIISLIEETEERAFGRSAKEKRKPRQDFSFVTLLWERGQVCLSMSAGKKSLLKQEKKLSSYCRKGRNKARRRGKIRKKADLFLL